MEVIESYKKKSIQRMQNKYKTSITFINPTIQIIEDKLSCSQDVIRLVPFLLLPTPISYIGESIRKKMFPKKKIMILEEDHTLANSIKILQNENSDLKKLIKQLEEQKNATIG